MLIQYFDNSTFGIIITWSGWVGSDQGKWTRGHLVHTSKPMTIITKMTVYL